MARERLFNLIEQLRQHRVGICVVGPPGAGKTSLVASWLDARSVDGIWYQLDAADADLATFFYYLGEGCKPFTRKTQRRLPAFTPEYLSDPSGFAKRFFRSLFSRLPTPSTLVLDNYQEIDAEQEFHRVIAEAVGEVPEGVTLIVISRNDTPAAYSRLIANEQVAVVDSDELKLTLSEASEIAARKGLSDLDRVRAIHAKTDGWAAGVTLMLERGEVGRETELHAPIHQMVFDYFADQILSKVAPSVRDFLIGTAWLPTVSIEAARALTGEHAAKEILEDLHRRHLFVHRRAANPPSYQYHALLRDFLHSAAEASMDPVSIDRLKLATARQLTRAGDAESAIELFHQLAEWDEYVRLVILLAPDMLYHGRWRTLQDWVGRLPEGRLEETPSLCYWLGYSNLSMQPATARNLLKRAFILFREQGDVVGQILSLTAIMQSHWAEYSAFDEVEHCLELVLPLIESNPIFPDCETELRVRCSLLLGMLLRQPRNPLINPTLGQVRALIDSPVSADAKLMGASVLMGYCLATGRLETGAWAVAAVERAASTESVSPVSWLMWMLRLPQYLTFCGEHEKARRALDEAEALLEAEGIAIGRPFFHYYGSIDSVLAGDVATGKRHLSKLEALIATSRRSFDVDLAHWLGCVIYLAEGKAAEAVVVGQKALEGARQRNVAWAQVWFGVAYIHALLDSEKWDAAEQCTSEVRRFLTGTFLERYEVELLFAEAYLAFVREDRQGFLSLLRSAWNLARQHDFIFGYRSTFRVHRLLFSESLREGIELDYVQSVIRRFGLVPPDPMDDRWAWRIKIYTLGRFEIVTNGERISFGRKTPHRPLALLKALIAYGGVAVPEQHLVDVVWPDQDGDAARISYKAAVYRLRRLLGGTEALVLRGGTISFNTELIWVDAVVLVRGATDAFIVRRLYAGCFLPGENQPWVVTARRRLTLRFVQSTLETARRLEEAGRLEEACEACRTGIEVEGSSKELYEVLIRLQTRRGLRREAKSTYRQMRRTLPSGDETSPTPRAGSTFRNADKR